MVGWQEGGVARGSGAVWRGARHGGGGAWVKLGYPLFLHLGTLLS